MVDDIVAEDILNRYNNLALEDEEDGSVQIPTEVAPHDVFQYVGVLFTENTVDEIAMRRTLSNLWKPKGGVNIKWIGPKNRFLITLFFLRDYDRVWEGAPWTFNNKLLALAPRQTNSDLAEVMVYKFPIWIQAFGVPNGYISKQICETLGRFGGELLEVDENNFKVIKPLYLRVRVMIDMSKPIKRRMKLHVNAGNHSLVQFQYERLPSMCFICGMFEHTEYTCPLTYVTGIEPPKKMYDQTIRATIRKKMITEEDRWLHDENGCSYVPSGSSKKAKSLEETKKELEELSKAVANRMEEDRNVAAS